MKYIIIGYEVKYKDSPIVVVKMEYSIERTYMGKQRFKKDIITHHANRLGVERKEISVDLSYKVIKGGKRC